MHTRTRLLIAEDDGLLRRSLVELLEMESEFEVIAQVPNGKVALEQMALDCPDVLLTDLEMPQMGGIQATREVKTRFPSVAVVILTKFGDDDNLFEAIRAGANGYVLKDASINEIKQAIRGAREGEGHLNPGLVSRVLSEFRRASESAKKRKEMFAELTRREMEILEMLAKGMRNKAIADELCLAEKTVKAHVGAVLRKLHVNDRTEAALLAQRHGLAE